MTRLPGQLVAARARVGRGKRPYGALAVAAMALLTAAACSSTNTYPIDFFPEMHYQDSWHAQEPDRPYNPESAVPYNVAVAPNVSREQAAQLENPLQGDQIDAERGAELFRVNCQQCHGPEGAGDGYMANFVDTYRAQNVNPPADLTSQQIQSLSDGELFWVLSNGLNRMPSFGNLLTDEERWQLVAHIRTLRAQ